MSALEQEIIEKFHLLEPAARQRVLEVLSSNENLAFDEDSWWSQVEALQSGMRAYLGEGRMVGALTMLEELREEEA